MRPLRPATRAIAAGAALLVVVAACAAGAPASPTGVVDASPAPATPTAPATPGASSSPAASLAGASSSPAASLAGASSLLLEVTTEGGFINPVATLSAVPALVVDTDGHVYTPGAQLGDGSLVAPVEVRDVGPAGASAILDAARTAGLDREEAGGGVAADTGTTVFSLAVDGDTVVNRFAASGPGGPGGPGRPGGPSPDASAGVDPAAAAFDLLARLTDPNVAWGGSAPAPTPYAPAAYKVFAAPAGDAGGAPTAAWPLTAGLEGFGRPAVPDFGVSGLRVGVVTGADAAALRPVLAAAAPGTLFTGGGTWTVWVRPLLPDELG